MPEAARHWDGSKYADNSEPQYRVALAMLDAHDFRGDESILDVGCGNGRITNEIARRVPRGRVVGADDSLSMLEFARQTYGGVTNLSFELQDAESLTYEDAFDVVVSFFCLQWVADKARAIGGIRRSLRPHGTAILVMPFRNQVVATIRKEMASEPRWCAYFADFSDPSDRLEDCDYGSYAVSAGLDVSSLVVDRFVSRLPNVEAYRERLATLSPHLVRLPEARLKEAFLDELLERVLQRTPQHEEGGLTHAYELTKLVAVRPDRL